MQTGELLSLVGVAGNGHQAEQLARLHAAGLTLLFMQRRGRSA